MKSHTIGLWDPCTCPGCDWSFEGDGPVVRNKDNNIDCPGCKGVIKVSSTTDSKNNIAFRMEMIVAGNGGHEIIGEL